MMQVHGIGALVSFVVSLTGGIANATSLPLSELPGSLLFDTADSPRFPGCRNFAEKPEARKVTPTRLLVILWDPHRPEHPAPSGQEVERAIFGPAPSVADYYHCQSAGLTRMERVNVLGWYHAKKPANHYWSHPVDARDGFASGHVEKWTEALDAAALEFRFSSLDTNHDGVLAPQEAGILVAIPQNGPFGTNRAPMRRELPTAVPLKIDGVRIPVIAEVYLGAQVNFPVIAHELAHLFFGMPDLYMNEPFPTEGAGPYSLMDISYWDSHIDPIEKLKKGWLKARKIRSSGEYSVEAVEQSAEVLKIDRPGSKNEFFLIENRQRGRYDKAIPDTGVAIWNSRAQGGRGNYRLVGVPGQEASWKKLWHDSSNAPIELHWMDGRASGIVVQGVSESRPTMSVRLNIQSLVQ